MPPTDWQHASPALRAAWLDALSDDSLKSEAGPSVFGRGVTYATGGAVQALTCTADDAWLHADAVVSGTQDYRAALDIEPGDGVQGDCDCPHAQDGYFCKHQVALALVVRSLLGGAAVSADAQAAKKVAAAAKRAQTQAANREALKTFVHQQSAARLAAWIWEQAQNDSALMAALKAWAALEQTSDDWPGIKAAITALLPPGRGLLDWMDATRYAQRAEPVLKLLQKHVTAHPTLGRQACEHALLRLYKVAEEADDSNGDLGGLVQQVQDLLIDTLRADSPPAAWLDRWFALMEADPWGLWYEKEVLEAAGDAVRERYDQRVSQDWQRWLQAHPAQPLSRAEITRRHYVLTEEDMQRRTLRQRYLAALERQGDVQATLEAMHASAQGDSEWAELITYCNDHNRPREALQYAQQAVKRVGSHSPGASQCARLLLACYERDGWDDEALSLRRQAFEAMPWHLPDYDALLRAAQAAGKNRAHYRAELFAWAEQREQRHRAKDKPGADVSLRVAWLLHEREDALALALAQPPNTCQPDLLRELAGRLPAGPNAQAAALLLRVFEAQMPAAQSPYREVLALVRAIMQRQTLVERSQWLALLRATYKAKRNFIAGLPLASQ